MPQPLFDTTPYSNKVVSLLESLYGGPSDRPVVQRTSPIPSMYGQAPGQAQPFMFNLAEQVADDQEVTSLIDQLAGKPPAPEQMALPAQGLPLQQATSPESLQPQHPAYYPQASQRPQAQQSQPARAQEEPFQPVSYVTNGGTSTMVGGYGANSEGAQWALARHRGLASPAAMGLANAQNRVMEQRNTQQYQDAYMRELQATGNPRLAAAQADALFATTDPGYASAFINSGQDIQTQAGFDEGIMRQNFAASINPAAGRAVNASLPYWGTGYTGNQQDGYATVRTSDGTAVAVPHGTTMSSLNQALTGKPAARDPNELTAYQRGQLTNGSERNRQAAINNLNGSLNAATGQLGRLMQNGATPDQIALAQGTVDRLTQQVLEATGFAPSATPLFTNSNQPGGQ